ncbi:MAG: isoprenylcysteine carboxylmethyltransferase family protein [Caldilineaceae bacterium]
MKKLILPTLRTFAIGVVALGLLLFLPAWTLNYWQGWLFIVVFLVAVNGIGVYLSLYDPELLERRKKFGPASEESPAQKIIMTLAIVVIPALFIFCALDHRFGWSPVPTPIVLLGDLMVALGLYVNLLVFRANSYGGSTIETVENQKVITTGPYALVRHPMYVGVLIMVAGVPLALGSWWGLLIVALEVPVLAWRILDEERILRQDLPGYTEYTQKVHYRLVPNLW